jgi:putative membrane protein
MQIKRPITQMLQGVAVGAANVIPGLSGGTIALITGIFARLIHSVKSFNGKAINLLVHGKIKEFLAYTDFWFLFRVLMGVAIAIISAARILGYLFEQWPVYIWSFFFGMILISVYYVGKTIRNKHWSIYLFGATGLTLAAGITFMTPGSENEGFLYLMLCGAAAMCSMILPGLSGSFILIILGNYQLVFIEAVNEWRFEILVPFAIGAAVGVLSFSHLLSWVLKKYHAQTMALLTGFIAGSLGVLWPWKHEVIQLFGLKEKVVGYEYFLPGVNLEFLIAMLIMLSGILIIILLERQALVVPKKKP